LTKRGHFLSATIVHRAAKLLRNLPPPWVYEGTDGVLVLYNGVTRATRIAKIAPGTLIRVEVIGVLPKAFHGDPKIGDVLP
jgi:hypothetical protein